MRRNLTNEGPICVLRSATFNEDGFKISKTVGASTSDKLIIGINHKTMTFVPESPQTGFFYFNQQIRYNNKNSDLVISARGGYSFNKKPH